MIITIMIQMISLINKSIKCLKWMMKFIKEKSKRLSILI